MKHKRLVMAIVMFAATGAAYAAQAPAKAAAKDADQQARISKLPAAVRATVEAESKGATIKGVSSEKASGKTVYELETLVDGRTRDLMIDSAGKVYIVEEQLDLARAPAAVRAAMEAKGTIVVLESVMQRGKTTYEGQVQTKAGKKIAVEVDADGKPIKK